MKTKFWTTYLIVGLLPLISSAGVTVAVSPNPIFVGERGAFEIVSSDGKPELLSYPEVDGVTWIKGAPQTSIQIRNFDRTDKLSYFFTPTKPGTITIPSAQIKVDDRVLRSKPIQLTVQQRQFQDNNNTATLDDLIFLKVTYDEQPAPPETIYLGQEITINITLFVDQRLQLYTDKFNQAQSFTNPENYFPEVSIENAVFHDYSEQNKYNNKFYYRDGQSQIIDGKRYQVYSYWTSVAGVEVGLLDGVIEHTVPIVDASRESRRRRSAMDDFFNDDFFRMTGRGRGKKIFTHTVQTSIPAIAVTSIPNDTSTEGHYLGLIGSWATTLKLDKPVVKVGEDATLTLEVTGKGNIATLSAPDLELPGFRIYPPEITRESAGNSRGVVSWVIIPLNADAQLPKLVFKTFDADAGVFLSNEFKPDLVIKPAETATEAGVIVEDYGTRQIDQLQPSRELHRASDILYIKKKSGRYIQLPLWKNIGATLSVVGVAGPVAYVCVLLLTIRRKKLHGNVLVRRRRDAGRNRARVFKALSSASPDELPNVIRDELNPYLFAMMDLPPGATLAELLDKLNDPELADMLKQAEAGGFMPMNSARIDAGTLIKKVKKLALVLISFFVCGFAYSQEPFDQAAAAYDDGRLDEAEEIYKSLWKSGFGNANTLYNLGNCSYRKGEYGQAIVYYERARRLAPRDSDILENLNFVRGQLSLPPVPLRDTPTAVFQSVRDQLRPDQWLLLGAGNWGLFWIVLCVSRWRGRSQRIVPIVVIVMFIASIWCYFDQFRSTYRSNQAVVVTQDTPLYRLPAQNGEDKAKSVLDSGEYVSLVEQRPEWSRIRIDQAEGWVKNSSIETIW